MLKHIRAELCCTTRTLLAAAASASATTLIASPASASKHRTGVLKAVRAVAKAVFSCPLVQVWGGHGTLLMVINNKMKHSRQRVLQGSQLPGVNEGNVRGEGASVSPYWKG